MLRNKYIEEEIWRLKNKDIEPKIKEDILPPNLIDSPLDKGPSNADLFRLASEAQEDEFKVIELPALIKEFNELKKKNPSLRWEEFYNNSTRVHVGDGGPIKNKPRGPKGGVKKINMADYHKFGMTVASLTDDERKVLGSLLSKMLKPGHKDN